MLPQRVHVVDIRQVEGKAADNTLPTEDYPREDELTSLHLRKLADTFRPVLIVVKLTGQFFGETSLVEGSRQRNLCISQFFSTVVVLGQWLVMVLVVISHCYIGFSSMDAFFFLLVTTIWYMQCAGSTTVCLLALPLTGKKRSRFARFLSRFATTAPELDGIKRSAVKGLVLACLAAVINTIVIGLFDALYNGIISILPPWNGQRVMYWTVRVIELVLAPLVSFAWTLSPLIFCITCMLLEKMFDTLQNKMANDWIQCFTIAYLRQEHLKLCEMVELANAVFSPLLFVIISLDIPLMCVNFYQLIRRTSGRETIVILGYMYWSSCFITLLVVIFVFGNRVNEKVGFYALLRKWYFKISHPRNSHLDSEFYDFDCKSKTFFDLSMGIFISYSRGIFLFLLLIVFLFVHPVSRY